MLRMLLALLLSLSVIAPVTAQSPTPSPDPNGAVFLLVTYDREPGEDGLFHEHGIGTGFFIAPDGTALTASHVVYAAAHYPARYRLLAIVGKEFYDTAVVCSSRLPYDPMAKDSNLAGVPFTRDVAEVKLAPTAAFEGRKDELYLLPKSGPTLMWATAHRDALPVFPYLAIGGTAKYGSRVRVVGFGLISAIPRRWTSEGQIGREFFGPDGTPLFDIISSNPAQPGDSGSPVLDERNQVVGIWAWHRYNEPDTGTMEGSAAFEKPCR